MMASVSQHDRETRVLAASKTHYLLAQKGLILIWRSDSKECHWCPKYDGLVGGLWKQATFILSTQGLT